MSSPVIFGPRTTRDSVVGELEGYSTEQLRTELSVRHEPRLTRYGEPMIEVVVTLPDGRAALLDINAHVLEGIPPGDVLGGYGNQCAAEIGKSITATYRKAQSA